jgi:hypothetical protein
LLSAGSLALLCLALPLEFHKAIPQSQDGFEPLFFTDQQMREIYGDLAADADIPGSWARVGDVWMSRWSRISW